ncbi:MAG: hypothetical protein JSW02_01415 [candidate division WOR-3 bacterium]|nr:MAG: hypothetical protein JSW02_01415 [candidate division WOR-3 bacterium]
MKLKVEDIFARLLEEIEEGRNIEDCLAEYPDHAEELRSLLHLAGAVKQMPGPVPRREAVQQAIRNVRQMVQADARAVRRFSWRAFLLHPVTVRTALAAVLVIILGWTTVGLSAASLPGEILYPVKRLSEQVQYFFTTSSEGKAEMHILFADRRTEEFIMTFEPGERIDQRLLESMLREAASAQQFVDELPAEFGEVLQRRIDVCNRQQLSVLEHARDRVCDCDREMIDAAINTCRARHGCMPDTGDADEPCCD